MNPIDNRAIPPQRMHALEAMLAASEPWAGGEATPFLPGATVHTLRLRPAGATQSMEAVKIK